MDFETNKKVTFLFSFYSYIPEVPKEVHPLHIFISISIILFVLYLLFRIQFLKISNKTLLKTLNSHYVNDLSKGSYIEENIKEVIESHESRIINFFVDLKIRLLNIKYYFDNKTNKLIDYINKSKMKNHQRTLRKK